MNWYYRILIFLFMIPLQTVFFESIQVAGVKPDLALVFVFVAGWVWGKRTGFYWGLALGGLIDLFTFGTLGITLIFKGMLGLVAGILGKSFLHLSLYGYVLIFLIVSLLHDTLGFLYLYGTGTETLYSILTGEVLIRAIYNAVLAIVAILLIWANFDQKGVFEYGGTILSPGRKAGARK